MSDLIDRQAAIDAIEQLDLPEDMCMFEILSHIELALGTLPSAQPERKTGRWIDETLKPWGLVHHPYKCSQCGEHSEMDSDFCPNCGADMRGEQDG